MTDLHVHILPGVDDGSPNLSTSLEMAEMAAQSGVRILAVTPHANQTGKLEYTQDGIIYRFTPESNAWKITIKNNTNKNARINWEKGSFIINGKASGISLYPFTSDDPPMDVIKEKSEITRTVTASNLIKGKKVNKIYSKRNLKRNGRTSVNIALPIGIGNKPQFFHIFNFIVTAN